MAVLGSASNGTTSSTLCSRQVFGVDNICCSGVKLYVLPHTTMSKCVSLALLYKYGIVSYLNQAHHHVACLCVHMGMAPSLPSSPHAGLFCSPGNPTLGPTAVCQGASLILASEAVACIQSHCGVLHVAVKTPVLASCIVCGLLSRCVCVECTLLTTSWAFRCALF